MDTGGYAQVTGACHFHFPEDHGAHPDYRTEWWYYTGNVQAADGRAFGFQLTFFRRAIVPPGAALGRSSPVSAWRTRQIYLAHAAISDISAGRHLYAETMARAALGLSGVRTAGLTTTVRVGSWQAVIGPEAHRLRARTDRFSFDLSLVPEKAPVANGEGGYSRKGRTPDRASCYYSLTRLSTTGALVVDGRRFQVKGLAWMDHEYSSAPLESDVQGWDWFGLQLDDGTEIMAYVLRDQSGRPTPFSSGTRVLADGTAVHLSAGDFRISVLDHWKSPVSGARYPSAWRLDLPSAHLSLFIHPRMADQEMRTPETTGVTYWEGAVAVTGNRDGRPLAGTGYVELTGYDRRFDAPL